jgi:hypothetical protein
LDQPLLIVPDKRIVTLIYNIPAALLPRYRDVDFILRAHDPVALVAVLADEPNLEHLVHLRLSSLPVDIEPLLRWPPPAPLELILAAPALEFAQLYRCARLVDVRPVRVTIPVAAGFGKAARVAVALRMAVKLDIGQPGPDLIPELAEVLDFYLHQPTVAQPIEYFHSIWLSLFHRQPVDLWTVQEEDPAVLRYVEDDGTERLPGRLANSNDVVNPEGLVAELRCNPAAAGVECAACAFFADCGGYFKWPRRDFDCAGVIGLFQTLTDAAAEVRADLARFDADRGGATP